MVQAGWFGQGYGQGTQVQLRYLKVRHTDFIFAAMAEEFGFVGTVLIISLLVFVIFRCFRAARQASDMFGSLIAYGFGFLIFFQTAVNIGVNLKVIPGDRPDAAFYQLWRQLAAFTGPGHWPGGKCDFAPQTLGVLIVELFMSETIKTCSCAFCPIADRAYPPGQRAHCAV